MFLANDTVDGRMPAYGRTASIRGPDEPEIDEQEVLL